MKFECPHCHQHLETATLYKGQGTKCPQCGGDLQIPGADGRRLAAPLQESPTPVGASLVDAQNESAGSVRGTALEPEGRAGPPDPPSAEGDWRIDITKIKQALQSSIKRDGVTITEYMEKQKLEGGVSLDNADSSTDEKGRKYKPGIRTARDLLQSPRRGASREDLLVEQVIAPEQLSRAGMSVLVLSDTCARVSSC